MKFREIMMSVTSTKKINDKGETMEHPGLDPFDHVTIASACQAVYRELFLEEEYETYLTDRITSETTKRPTKFEKGVKVGCKKGGCCVLSTSTCGVNQFCFCNYSYVIHTEYIYFCFHQLNIAHER